MNVDPISPPRVIAQRTAAGEQADLRHSANIRLEPGELVTFVSGSGSEYDVVRMPWGYYATPSLNVRLPAKGLRPCLSRGQDGKCYVLLVERGQEEMFLEHARKDRHTPLAWLDDDKTLAALEQLAAQGGKP